MNNLKHGGSDLSIEISSDGVGKPYRTTRISPKYSSLGTNKNLNLDLTAVKSSKKPKEKKKSPKPLKKKDNKTKAPKEQALAHN